MVKFLKKNLFVIFLVLFSLLFFYKTIVGGLLPIPSDTIVGLYYPFRDNYAKDYPRGVPFKNFLITDPVRQLYPWKNLIIESEKKIELPLWNPYNFSGSPLLANFQSGAFYPLNLLYFIIPFESAWSIIIIISPLLAGLFMYLYLDNFKLKKEASILGALAFSFSGFFVAWMEWGNILHTALWLPIVLLSIDKILSEKKKNAWSLLLLAALTFSFFAGHLQTFFYISVLALAYIIFRIFAVKEKISIILRLTGVALIFALITAPQWIPSIQFILLSARNSDLPGISNPGWFIPWQNIVQFIAPDFFGNPTTLNYWGIWNYAEFVGYIGIVPLMMAILAIINRRDKNTLFFVGVLIVSLLLAFPNPVSKIPFLLNIPFISTAQPTRLLVLVGFSLSVLCAMGADFFLKEAKKTLSVLLLFLIFFGAVWVFILGKGFGLIEASNLAIAKKNMILPTVIFMIAALLLVVNRLLAKKKLEKFHEAIILGLIVLSIIDLFRFGWKFETFASSDYLFPNTKVLSFIKKDKDQFRVMTDNSEIFPPNFSVMYKIQTPDGYDPLYIKRYGELIASYARNKPDIAPPFGFNRIITWQDYKGTLADLVGIRYVLSKEEINNPKLTKVYSDGVINVYKNNNAYPRVFFVTRIITATNDQEEINNMMNTKDLLSDTAFVETKENLANKKIGRGRARITEYSANKIIVETENDQDGFLVLTDTYYPTWKVTIDGKPDKIYITDYAFRGVFISKGKHMVEFYNTLF
ncbi:MAG TPA: YfhO family protein [Patescibacteria group bacterium]|nr:YfhO family protein [Patescibacteria group bacterium]